MNVQRCAWPLVVWYLLIRHLLGREHDSNCSLHFARRPVELAYALSPILLLLNWGLVSQCRPGLPKIGHELKIDFFPSMLKIFCVSSFLRSTELRKCVTSVWVRLSSKFDVCYCSANPRFFMSTDSFALRTWFVRSLSRAFSCWIVSNSACNSVSWLRIVDFLCG